jgi:hypothetical protein
MIVRATAHPAYPTHRPHAPLRRPPAGLAPLIPGVAPPARPEGKVGNHFDADFGDTDWVDLDDDTDAAQLGHEADAADAALLRCVGCAAFATLVLALVSSLQLG